MRFYLTLSAADNSIIIRDWNIIQTRSVDPYANVDSDIANNLHIIFNKNNVYFTGLSITGYSINNINNNGTQYALIATLSPGTVMMNNVSIKFTDDIKIPLYEFASNTTIAAGLGSTRYVVVEYSYEKVIPAPIAEVKAVTTFDSTKHLKLYTFKINNQLTLSGTSSSNINSFLTAWNSNSNSDYTKTDNRFETGVIFRSGDTMSGHLRIIKEVSDYTSSSDYNAVNKKYVDQTLTSSGLTNAVKKTNADGTLNNLITIPITWQTSRTPQSNNELVTWGHVQNRCLTKAGSNQVITGTISVSESGNANFEVPVNPKTDFSAVNKKYVELVLGGMSSSAFVLKTGGDGAQMQGIITVPTNLIRSASENTKLINQQYADERYVKFSGTGSSNITGALKVDTSSYTIDPDSGNVSTLVTRKYCDETYISTTTQNITLSSIPKLSNPTGISDNAELISRAYADTRYIRTSSISLPASSDTSFPRGKLKLSNNFVLYWDMVSITLPSTYTTSSWYSFSFQGTPFSSYCYNVSVTWAKTQAQENTNSNGYVICPCVRKLTKNGFEINFGNYSSGGLTNETLCFYIQAIGK